MVRLKARRFDCPWVARLSTLIAVGLLGLTMPLTADPGEEEVTAQRKLYLLHCAVCHGDDGQGDGRAARFLFPKPRDFSTGKIRLVSSENRVASASDLRRSIQEGFPGTSMQGWKTLEKEAIDQLVAEVIRLRKNGVRERLIEAIREDSNGESVDDRNLDLAVQELTVARGIFKVPTFDTPKDASIQRGEKIYLSQSCHSCHGVKGDGSWKKDLIDDKGRPSWATDFRFDPLKTGGDPVSMARTIRLGMPGSAMPSSRKLSDAQLVDLVRFCRSLSREPKYELTNHQRAQRAEGYRRPKEPK